jgi:hypothetical protein
LEDLDNSISDSVAGLGFGIMATVSRRLVVLAKERDDRG